MKKFLPTQSKRHRKQHNRKDYDTFTDFLETPFQFQEAYNSLRTNLKFLSANNEYKKIVITSSVPDEGKSNVALYLSASLAMSGSKVVLLDCDLRKPTLHRYLKIPDGTSRGLTNVLRNPTDIESSGIEPRQNRFYVIPAGPIPPNPTELLSGAMTGKFIDELSKIYDYVIMDTAPVSIVTDAAVLSQHADGVIMVVRQKMVTFEQARQAKKNLDAVNANILGVVLNDFDMRHLDGSYSYYYYNYYYHYGDKK